MRSIKFVRMVDPCTFRIYIEIHIDLLSNSKYSCVCSYTPSKNSTYTDIIDHVNYHLEHYYYSYLTSEEIFAMKLTQDYPES